MIFEVYRVFKDVSWMSQKVFRIFTESFKVVSRKFKGGLKEVSRLLQESFNRVSRKFL